MKTLNGRCVTARDAARLVGQAAAGGIWSPAKDSRSIINRQYAALRFKEEGAYHMLYGAARVPKQGERCSGDNFTFCESPGDQVIMSLSDGMGSGEEACRESGQVVELTQQLLETGFSPRSALKLVNTVLLLSGAQHPATLDLSCVDLHTAVLEVMKLGAVPTFIIGQEGAEQLEETEMEPFVETLEPLVSGKKILLFGSYGWGDGEWMRDWTERMKNAGAVLVRDEGIIANEAPDDGALEECRAAGRDLAAGA